MSTGKTIAIVAGVGVGAYLLLRALSPARTTATSKAKPAATSTGTTLLGLIPIAQSFFARSSSSISSSGSGPYFPAVNTVDTSAQQSYAISHGVTDLEGNQIIDLNTGNAVEYGPW